MMRRGDNLKNNRCLRLLKKKVFLSAVLIIGIIAMNYSSGLASVATWGYNYYGQLGDGTTTSSLTPVQVNGLSSGVTDITAGNAGGSAHIIVRKSDGTLWGWGRNDASQVYDYNIVGSGPITSPIQIGSDTDWASVAVGSYHTIAIKSNGTLWGWGDNSVGQLGDGTITLRETPVQIGSDTNWVYVATSSHHTMAIKSDGTLWGWGLNDENQVYDYNIVGSGPITSPIQIGSDADWASVAAGNFHTIALKSNGTLWAWGDSPATNINQSVSVQIGTDTDWISVAASQGHILALKSNGTLWACGSNAAGQLGDGTTITRTALDQIGSDTSWVFAAAGTGHSMARKSDGTVWSWGANANGQLGDGTTANSSTPVQVTSLNNVWTIAAGWLSSIAGTNQPDEDADGVPNTTDNCLDTPNQDQTDTDGDGYGDVCDNAPLIDNPGQSDFCSTSDYYDGEGYDCNYCQLPYFGTADGVGDVINCPPQVISYVETPPASSYSSGIPEYVQGDPLYLTAVVEFNPSDIDGDGNVDTYHVFPPTPYNIILRVYNLTDSQWLEPQWILDGPPYVMPNDLVTISGSSQTFTTLIDLTQWYPDLVAGKTYEVEGTYVNFVKDPEVDSNGNCTNIIDGCYAPIWTGEAPAILQKFNIKSGSSFVSETCNGIDDNSINGIDEGYPVGNTLCGTNIIVTTGGVTFTFDSVTRSGETVVNTSSAQTNPGIPGPPSGFKMGSPPTYYEISTSATFSTISTSDVMVCIIYDPADFKREGSLKLFHWTVSGWDDVTTSLDTGANKICGETKGFSPFIVAESAESSTAVTLSSLSANKAGDGVVLTWSTSSETDNEGFFILRGESANGPFAPVNATMIPALGGPGMKARYSYRDSQIEPGKTYYYRLQDVDNRGMITTHNVIPATTDIANGSSSPYDKTSSTNTARDESTGKVAADNIIETMEHNSKATDNSKQSASVVIVDSSGNKTAMSAGSQSGDSSEAISGIKQETTDSITSLSGIIGEAEVLTDGKVGVKVTEDVANVNISKPASLSFTIEDENGNILVISKVDDKVRKDTGSPELQITEGHNQILITWEGTGLVKGFVLYRSDKGKGQYIPLSGVVPYIGKDGKERYRYQFIDKGVKTKAQYDYRLEVVKVTPKDRIGYLSNGTHAQ